MTDDPTDFIALAVAGIGTTLDQHTVRLDQITLRLSRMERDLGNLYRAVGELRGDFASLSVQLDEFDQRLDRIERRLKLSDEAQPGWAESVASPDEDVGFVFTRIPADLSKLPVDISVGDDTPLVIACPKSLDAETVAAIRHWVVRNKDVLDDHWHDRIDSVDLIGRIKDIIGE